MALTPKEVAYLLMAFDLVLGAVAKSSFVYDDRHNKVDLAGRLGAPSPLAEDFRLHRPTCERDLRPKLILVERGRTHVMYSNLCNLLSHAGVLKRCYVVVFVVLAQHVLEVRGLSAGFELAAYFERDILG